MALVEKNLNQESRLAMAKAGSIPTGKMFVLSNLGFQFCKIRKLDQPHVFKAFKTVTTVRNIYMYPVFTYIHSFKYSFNWNQSCTK